jgi:hypothetical protein
MRKCQNSGKSSVNSSVKDNPMNKRRIWQVWKEIEGQEDEILFEGSESEARKYFKKHGGSRAGLHIGYPL